MYELNTASPCGSYMEYSTKKDEPGRWVITMYKSANDIKSNLVRHISKTTVKQKLFKRQCFSERKQPLLPESKVGQTAVMEVSKDSSVLHPRAELAHVDLKTDYD